MPETTKKESKTKYQVLLEALVNRDQVDIPFSIYDDTISIMLGDWALEIDKNGKWDIG